jgi:hypothetical protein
MHIVPHDLHLWTVLKVLGVRACISANVLRSSRTEEGVLHAGAVGSVKLDDLLVNTLLLKKV